MIRPIAAVMLALPVAVSGLSAHAQYYRTQPYYQDTAANTDQLPPPGLDPNLPQQGQGAQAPSSSGVPGAGQQPEGTLPPPGFATLPDGTSPYGHQLNASTPNAPATQADPDAIRPPQPVGGGQQPAAGGTAAPAAPSGTAALPPEDQPEVGQPKALPENLRRQLVDYQTKEPAGTIIVDTAHTYLYLVLGKGKALRYGVRVGREGFTWTGTERISRMKEWPDWFPPPEMIERQPYLPRMMAGGPGNPLGARAMYLGHTLYRIHGTNQPSTIGHYVSSGCVGMLNDDVEDLYGRVQVGTRVVVLPGNPPEAASNASDPAASANGASVMAEPAPTATGAVSNSAVTSRALPPVRRN